MRASQVRLRVCIHSIASSSAAGSMRRGPPLRVAAADDQPGPLEHLQVA